MSRNKIDLTHDLLLEYFIYHEDGHLIWKKSKSYWISPGEKAGCVREDGYITVGFLGHKYLLHRLIFFYHKKEMPLLLDHIDLDHTNNRIENLRKANKRINSLNRTAPINTSSGKAGVSWDTKQQKWAVRWKNSETKIYEFHGYFTDKQEAIEVRENLERREKLLWQEISG